MVTTLATCLCPSDAQPPVPGYGRINYRFGLGPTPLWAAGDDEPLSLAGPFTVNRVYTAASFTDGLSTTIGTPSGCKETGSRERSNWEATTSICRRPSSQ